MFNRALFKQSAKANFTKWIFVTIPTCIMLAIVIIVLGNLGIDNIRDSLKNVFIQADQESYLKENCVDSYDLYLSTQQNYNNLYGMGAYTDIITNKYDEKVKAFKNENAQREPTEEEVKTIILDVANEFSGLAGMIGQDPEVLKGLVTKLLNVYKLDTTNKGTALVVDMVVLDYENAVKNFIALNDREITEEEKQTIIETVSNNYGSLASLMGKDSTEFVNLIKGILNTHLKTPSKQGYRLLEEYIMSTIYSEAYKQNIDKGETVEVATQKAEQARIIGRDAIGQYNLDLSKGNMPYNVKNYLSVASDYVNKMMYDSTYEINIELGVTEDEAKTNAVAIKVISNSAISTYQLMLDEYTVNNAGSEITQEQIKASKNKACASISDQIPEKVSIALEELGNMDIYGLIIGSIFYRIAGLLLPMVFVIMTANGLLAGQVDSGSMAYVLSTPTKRKTVAVTQMTYLLASLFTMFALLTSVSVLAVWIVGGNSFAINFGEILLFNLGAFLTMFAIAGYCFMCSCIFNRTKFSLSIGGGLTIFSLVCTILGLFGSQVVPSAMRISSMNFFNYLSIITLFDTVSILEGSLNYLWQFGILLAVGIVTFIVGIFRFDKKDLPL